MQQWTRIARHSGSPCLALTHIIAVSQGWLPKDPIVVGAAVAG